MLFYIKFCASFIVIIFVLPFTHVHKNIKIKYIKLVGKLGSEAFRLKTINFYKLSFVLRILYKYFTSFILRIRFQYLISCNNY